MKKMYVLYADDVKLIMANLFGTKFENVSVPSQLQIHIAINEEKFE